MVKMGCFRAPMALAVASRSIGLSHFPKARGAPGGASADMARVERAGQIALHGLRFWRAVSLSLGAVTCASPV